MSNIINIFNTLPQHQSDSEDEGHQEKVQPQKGQNQNRRQQDEKPKRGQQDTRQPEKQQQQKDQAPKGGRTGVQGDISKKEERDYHNHNKDLHKQQKDNLDRPHPNDRHSGHGGSAYGVKPKKGGAGKGNWGNYKDEENVGEAGSPVEGQEAPKEEEKAELTLQEYYQQHRTAQNEPQINEAKAKITSEQLMKEMGTATLLKSRAQLTVDDRKAGQKKEKLNVDHHAAVNTEHANLLNFRTGFIEKEYKPRDREEGGNFQKRDNRRREEREQEGEKQTAEVAEGQTGETQPVEGTQQETEQGREEHGQRRRGGYQGGYHGERRGYGGRGHRGGYGRRHQEGEGEGRFQGDEQGDQGVSTGYTYKGGRGGNRQGGYRGGQNRRGDRGQHYQPREGQQHHQPREGQQQHQPREGQQQQAGEQQQHQQPQRQEQQHRGGQEHRGERQQGGRKPYGKGPQPKVNVADESAFPKLG